MKIILSPKIEHMIREAVELELKHRLPKIIRSLVKDVLDEKNAIEFEEANFTDF